MSTGGLNTVQNIMGQKYWLTQGCLMKPRTDLDNTKPYNSLEKKLPSNQVAD